MRHTESPIIKKMLENIPLKLRIECSVLLYFADCSHYHNWDYQQYWKDLVGRVRCDVREWLDDDKPGLSL